MEKRKYLGTEYENKLVNDLKQKTKIPKESSDRKNWGVYNFQQEFDKKFADIAKKSKVYDDELLKMKESKKKHENISNLNEIKLKESKEKLGSTQNIENN